MATVDLVQRLATLQAGRNIQLRPQNAITPGGSSLPPSSLSEGIDISDGGGVLLAWVILQMRADASYQRSVFQITTLSAGETYTVVLDYGDGEETYSYVAGGGDAEEDVLQQIADDINAAAPQKWEATVAGTGAAAALTVDGMPSVSILPYTVAASATGAGAMSQTFEASAVRFRVWGLPKGGTTWVRLPVEGRPNADTDKIEALQNYGERYVVAGMVRLYVEVISTDGSVTPIVAPALEE